MHASLEDPVSITEALKTLGLTKYEALVYVALLKVTRATATEIHELSGVPRASVYPALDRLFQRNMVTISHATPKRFSAIPPGEAVDSLMQGIDEKASYAKETLQKLYDRRGAPDGSGQELVWTITGDANITARLKNLIAQATDQIQLIGNWQLIEDLGETLALAAERVRMEVITERQEGEIYPDIPIITVIAPSGHAEMQNQERAGIILVDNSKVVVVVGSQGETPTALYSESDGFYRFFSTSWALVRGYGRALDQK
ncbi:MAG: HTH-type transcriptional regulator, sugar sensing transcriptional regulator [Methanofollis sp.]|nr:HTH-type transcriptional regulator, sugar sensing transcriptional regulator [Methanofollis sp.]